MESSDSNLATFCASPCSSLPTVSEADSARIVRDVSECEAAGVVWSGDKAKDGRPKGTGKLYRKTASDPNE